MRILDQKIILKTKEKTRLSALYFFKILIFLFTILTTFLIISPGNIKAQAVNVTIDDKDGVYGINSLMNAAINGDVQSIRFFCESSPNTINQKNIGGASALSVAARKGNLEISQILVEKGADVNNYDNQGWTPLMRSATSKNSNLFKFLLDSGADPTKLNSVNESVIVSAAYSQCNTCLQMLFANQFLMDKFNRNTLKNQIKQAVEIAGNKNNPEIKAILEDYLANQLINKNYNGSQTYENSVKNLEQIPQSQIKAQQIYNLNPSEIAKNNTSSLAYVESLDQESQKQKPQNNRELLKNNEFLQSIKKIFIKKTIENEQKANFVSDLKRQKPKEDQLQKTNQIKYKFLGTSTSDKIIQTKNSKFSYKKLLVKASDSSAYKAVSEENNKVKYKFLGNK